LSDSGDIAFTPGAHFLYTRVDPQGERITTNGKSPLDGHWPTINVHVSPQVPANRKLFLLQAGKQVQILPPARAHLYDIFSVSCDAFQEGTVETGNFAWEHLSSALLKEPDCGDYGNQNIHWYYAVDAPGYAIVAGQLLPR
jgi:hypothetical protein